jgi:hypothetical protein
VFQAVVIAQLSFNARYRIRKLWKLPTLTGIRQCAPVPTTASGDDCYSGIAHIGSKELLVEVPDQIVSGSNVLGHERPRVSEVNLAELIQLSRYFVQTSLVVILGQLITIAPLPAPEAGR